MFFHVRITEAKTRRDTVKLDLSKEQIEQRILEPHRSGEAFMLAGRQFGWDGIEKILITSTELSSDDLRLKVEAEQERRSRDSSVVVIGGPTLDWYIADSGEDMTDELLTRPAGSQGKQTFSNAQSAGGPLDPRNVMVVHGRNERLSRSMFAFLRSLDLNPMEWSSLRAATEKASPYVGEVLARAFQEAQAVVVVISGDDEAKLRDDLLTDNDPSYERELTPQGRPNVLFEAGMALAHHPDRTVIVEVGKLRPFSDLAGRHVVRMTNEKESRHDVAQRLISAGCPAVLTGSNWLTEGDFST